MANSRAPERKAWWARARMPLLLLLMSIAGCARLRGLKEPAPVAQRLQRTGVSVGPVAPESSEPVQCGDWIVSAQYDESSALRTGFNTFEVYLTNKGQWPIRLTSAHLNGASLPIQDERGDSSFRRVLTGAAEFGKGAPIPSSANGQATWWQFYPLPLAEPGDTIVFQVNFRKMPTHRQTLEIAAEDGARIPIAVPRFRMPDVLITSVTFTLDYGTVFVQYKSSSPPWRVWLNGNEILSFEEMASPEPGTPRMIAFKAPCRICTGMPLYIGLDFGQGKWRHSLVRALTGVTLDPGLMDGQPTKAECKDFVLDLDSPARLLPVDALCSDSRSGNRGGSADEVIRARLTALQADENTLAGLGLCTAIAPEVWNIYGQICDLVFSHSYRLGWGSSETRFIEEEDRCIRDACESARPRPFFWIPDTWPNRGRILEPAELHVMAWMAIMRGCKGFQYLCWRNPATSGIEDSALFRDSVRELNRQINERQRDLGPLALVSEEIAGDDRKGMMLYTAWAGDLGQLVMVRNLDYATDRMPNDLGRLPRFQPGTKRQVKVCFGIPEWLHPGQVSDFLDGGAVQSRVRGTTMEVELDRIDTFRLLWVPSAKRRGQGV